MLFHGFSTFEKDIIDTIHFQDIQLSNLPVDIASQSHFTLDDLVALFSPGSTAGTFWFSQLHSGLPTQVPSESQAQLPSKHCDMHKLAHQRRQAFQDLQHPHDHVVSPSSSPSATTFSPPKPHSRSSRAARQVSRPSSPPSKKGLEAAQATNETDSIDLRFQSLSLASVNEASDDSHDRHNSQSSISSTRGRNAYRMTLTEQAATHIVLPRHLSPDGLDAAYDHMDVDIDEGYVSARNSINMTTKTDDFLESARSRKRPSVSFEEPTTRSTIPSDRSSPLHAPQDPMHGIRVEYDPGDDGSIDTDLEDSTDSEYDSASDVGTPDSSPASTPSSSPATLESIVDDVLSSLRHGWISSAMNDVRGLFRASSTPTSAAGSTPSTSTSPELSFSGLPSASSSTSHTNRKRADDDPAEHDKDGGRKRRRVGSERPKTSKDDSLKLACPFYKHNPGRYRNLRACVGPGYDTMHRVKEHIYRRHAQPIHCARCWEIFSTDAALNQHQRSLIPCDMQEGTPPQGCNNDQISRLKSKRRMRPGQTEADRWRAAYLILFPDTSETEIPSPYHDDGLTNAVSPDAAAFIEWDEYYRRELLDRVRNRLEHAAQPLGASLRDQVIELVRSAQGTILESFQMERSTSGRSLLSATSTPRMATASLPTARSDPRDLYNQPPPTSDDTHSALAISSTGATAAPSDTSDTHEPAPSLYHSSSSASGSSSTDSQPEVPPPSQLELRPSVEQPFTHPMLATRLDTSSEDSFASTCTEAALEMFDFGHEAFETFHYPDFAPDNGPG